jgi:hypothetical protein
MLTSFLVALAAAGGVTIALGRRQGRRPMPLAPSKLTIAAAAVIAIALAVIAIPLAMAASGLVSWDAAATGAGCGMGIFGGQLLIARRPLPPG